MNTLDALDAQSRRTDIPDFRAGDTLKVHARVVEGSRSRIQVFQGVVIRRQGGGLRETFTVRKISFGVGVERTYPVNSPVLDRIEVLTRGHWWVSTWMLRSERPARWLVDHRRMARLQGLLRVWTRRSLGGPRRAGRPGADHGRVARRPTCQAVTEESRLETKKRTPVSPSANKRGRLASW